MPRGRLPMPAEQREKIIAHVLDEIAKGRALSRILREDEGMPAWSTFCKWEDQDEDLADKVVRARERGVEVLLEETVEIADDRNGDYVAGEYNPESVQRAKLRVETRHKYAQMIAPRKYGNKVDITSGGEKLPAAPPPVLIDARMQSLIALAVQRKAQDEDDPLSIEDLMR